MSRVPIHSAGGAGGSGDEGQPRPLRPPPLSWPCSIHPACTIYQVSPRRLGATMHVRTISAMERISPVPPPADVNWMELLIDVIEEGAAERRRQRRRGHENNSK